jgi:mannitol/fructose-specific phosphotransferase system IIA component (Ntr-type)/Kef-type K+ transport system membrane component KefB
MEMGNAAAEHMEPLLVLSVILLAGGGGGWVAKRLHSPRITGNIVAGAILGMTLFRGMDVAKELEALETFAMGLITVAVGGHLSYRRIRSALRRIVSIAVMEAVGAAVLVTVVIWWFGLVPNWRYAAVLGAVAAASAPATVVALVRENRAKGTYVKTLLSVVALDNMLCVVLFAVAQTFVVDSPSGGGFHLQIGQAVVRVIVVFAGSAVLGVVLGRIIKGLVGRAGMHGFSTFFIMILLGTGLSPLLGLNPLMTCLFLGVYLGNSTRIVEEQISTLEPIEPLLYTCFFTLAGTALRVDSLLLAGELVLVYLMARFIGKAVGAMAGGVIGRSSRRIWSAIPYGLVPQAGVAIGLVVLLEGDERVPTDVSSLVGTVVLAGVAISEIVGPFFTRAGLIRAKETGRDRPRLIEFLEEEFILTDMKATDKPEALRELTDFFVRCHRVDPDLRETIYESVVAREKEATTAIGLGTAIPHGRTESGTGIQGVLGICREGVDFGAPDGKPVRLFMLIVTPKEHEKRHLEVLASLVGMISDGTIRERLIAAIDANDAWEIIESEETPTYNYFLDDTEEEAAADRGPRASNS